jgi:hypothetical protein
MIFDRRLAEAKSNAARLLPRVISWKSGALMDLTAIVGAFTACDPIAIAIRPLTEAIGRHLTEQRAPQC